MENVRCARYISLDVLNAVIGRVVWLVKRGMLWVLIRSVSFVICPFLELGIIICPYVLVVMLQGRVFNALNA